jgi:hypothetical protein
MWLGSHRATRRTLTRMNMQNKAPLQYSPAGQIIKKFLHTKIGAFIGFHLGVSGFNRIQTQISRFQRFYTEGEKLGKKEFVQRATRDDGLSFVGVYKLPRLAVSYNSRVDAGAALTASLISGSTLGGISSPAAPKFIAVSPTTLTPAKGDTTLSGELSTNGFTRAAATAGGYVAPASLDGAASFTQSKTFTATGAQTVASTALFDAASTGNMFVEGNLASSATLAINDTLAITWTVNH